jgi:tetratricopeptide (TPR) repeat protein
MTNEQCGRTCNLALPRVILRYVIGWLVIAAFIPVQSLRGQTVPFSEISGTVCGEVLFQATGAPAVGVTVELTAVGGPFVASAQTDWSGRFRFTDLRAGTGTYVVAIELPGYERIQEPVRPDGVSQDLVFHLKSGLSAQLAEGKNLVSVRELRIPTKARDALRKGMERLQRKDAAGSLVQFTRAAAAFPGYYEAYYQMGVANVALGQAGEAEQDFQKAIDLSQGRFTEAQFGLGLLLCQRQQFAEAEPIIRKGLELDPDSARGHYVLARSLLGQARLEEAEKNARRAIRLNPAFALPHLVLADIHLHKRDSLSLLEDLDSYLKLEPDGTASAWAKKTRAAIRDAVSKPAETNHH